MHLNALWWISLIFNIRETGMDHDRRSINIYCTRSSAKQFKVLLYERHGHYRGPPRCNFIHWSTQPMIWHLFISPLCPSKRLYRLFQHTSRTRWNETKEHTNTDFKHLHTLLLLPPTFPNSAPISSAEELEIPSWNSKLVHIGLVKAGSMTCWWLWTSTEGQHVLGRCCPWFLSVDDHNSLNSANSAFWRFDFPSKPYWGDWVLPSPKNKCWNGLICWPLKRQAPSTTMLGVDVSNPWGIKQSNGTRVGNHGRKLSE